MQNIPSRFLQIWKKVSDLMNPGSNFAVFRRVWKEADLPKIPIPSIAQKDMMFIADGNDNFRDGGTLINFEKLQLSGRIVHQWRCCQQAPYCLKEVPEIQQYLAKDLFALKSEEITQIAKRCEPPEESPEKEKRHSLLLTPKYNTLSAKRGRKLSGFFNFSKETE